MVNSFVEKELKFDVDDGFVLPPLTELTELVHDGGAARTHSEQLCSVYYDTADHALQRSHLTLRRRTGTTDVGWQLKVPLEPFREEIQVDSTAQTVPDELSRLLVGVTRRASLLPIATLDTARSATRLVSADGRELAEIDDDAVRATPEPGDDQITPVVSAWRELEIELKSDDTGLLESLAAQLRRGGARPSASTSKLARALGTSTAGSSVENRVGPSAGRVAMAYIAEQQLVMLAGDVALRRGDRSAIHKTRVATRRLRSTLRVFGPLFEPARTAALDGQLRWYASLLGEVRDRQVLQRRLEELVGQVPPELVLGPVKARIHRELGSELTERWSELQKELESDRYLAILTDIADWLDDPPFSQRGTRSARLVPKLTGKAGRAVSRKFSRADATGDVSLLHAARKSAKRARYAAEAAEPVIGAKASRRQAKRYKKLQDLLGEHQDSLVSAAMLRRLGAVAGVAGAENGFTFGLLYQREQQQAELLRARARKIARRYR